MKILLLNEKKRKIFGDVAAAGSTRNVRSRRRQLVPLVFFSEAVERRTFCGAVCFLFLFDSGSFPRGERVRKRPRSRASCGHRLAPPSLLAALLAWPATKHTFARFCLFATFRDFPPVFHGVRFFHSFSMFKQFSHRSPPDDGRPKRCPLVAPPFLTGRK